MGAILAMARKDIRLALRDRAGFFFTAIFPIIMAVFFGVIFGGMGSGSDNRMPIVVADLDRTPASESFIKRLESSEELLVLRVEDVAAGESLVRTGKQTAVVTLPQGFGEGIDTLFAGRPIRLDVGVDPARKAEAGMLQGVLTRYAFEGFQSTFTDTAALRQRLDRSRQALRADADTPSDVQSALDTLFTSLDRFSVDLDKAVADDTPGEDGSTPAGGFNPIQITSRNITAEKGGPPSPFAITFPQGIVWGLIACCLSFAVSLVLERTRGTLTRLRVAPISDTQLLAGKGLACFITCVVMMTALLTLAWVAFKLTPVSLPLLAAAVLSASVCFVGIMMVIAAVSKTEAAAHGLGWGVLMLAAMFGGGMVPLFLMRGWMQTASNLSPIKWAVLALEGAIWRGFTPAQMLLPCAILTGVGVVCFAIGARLFRLTTSN